MKWRENARSGDGVGEERKDELHVKKIRDEWGGKRGWEAIIFCGGLKKEKEKGGNEQREDKGRSRRKGGTEGQKGK